MTKTAYTCGKSIFFHVVFTTALLVNPLVRENKWVFRKKQIKQDIWQIKNQAQKEPSRLCLGAFIFDNKRLFKG